MSTVNLTLGKKKPHISEANKSYYEANTTRLLPLESSHDLGNLL